MRVAVVGHVEWVDFLVVDRMPRPGEIVQAKETWQEAAGGGADAAVQLRKLAGSALLITALGDDALGRRAIDELSGRGVRVEAVWRDDPQRRAVCFLDDERRADDRVARAEARPARRRSVALARAGATSTASTSREATRRQLRAARQAKVLVASARELPMLREAGVELDVLVASAADRGEHYDRRARAPASLRRPHGRSPRRHGRAGRPLLARRDSWSRGRHVRRRRCVRRGSHVRPGERAAYRGGVGARVPLWCGRCRRPRPVRRAVDALEGSAGVALRSRVV